MSTQEQNKEIMFQIAMSDLLSHISTSVDGILAKFLQSILQGQLQLRAELTELNKQEVLSRAKIEELESKLLEYTEAVVPNAASSK